MSSTVTALRGCLACRVQQCCCCSLRFGVIFISIILFIDACFAFAGEAALYFDMASAITSQLEGQFLQPGQKLSADGRVHGGLIFAGLYMLVNSLLGVLAVARRSYRAAYAFFVLIVIDTTLAIAISAIVVMAGGLSFASAASQIPGAAVQIYCCIVCNSYRIQLRDEGHGMGAAAAHNLPPMSRTFDDGGAADTTVDVEDVAVVEVGGRAKGTATTRAGKTQIVEDEDADGDISHGGQQQRV